jgi:hypothetical protein
MQLHSDSIPGFFLPLALSPSLFLSLSLKFDTKDYFRYVLQMKNLSFSIVAVSINALIIVAVHTEAVVIETMKTEAAEIVAVDIQVAAYLKALDIAAVLNLRALIERCKMTETAVERY